MTGHAPRSKSKRSAKRSGGWIPASCSTGKRSYRDRHTARAASRQIYGRRGFGPFDVYRCLSGCGQYHLATRR